MTHEEWREGRELAAKLPRMLTMRERGVLDTLATQKRSAWFCPMDIGGRDGSHHSNTLRALGKLGLVERKKYHAIYCFHGTHYVVDKHNRVKRVNKPIQRCCCKGSCRYRATPKGRRIYK